MSTTSLPRSRAAAPTRSGVAGNELLTSVTAAVLVVLLAAEGLTILFLDGLLTEHMFIGIMLLGPVALKLASTGYRFARYYAGSPDYREKGPPVLGLRLLAPLLVAATVGVFASGVALLLVGHRSDLVLTVHKASFVVWGGCFAVHLLAHLPRMIRGVGREAQRRVAGSAARAALLGGSLAAGLALALALLSAITGWHGGHD